MIALFVRMTLAALAVGFSIWLGYVIWLGLRSFFGKGKVGNCDHRKQRGR